ncbi:hypothetical protein [Kibdelosporangium phytohabitans]|uniref:VWA domain-containing protein n=1 Tax=Kibdelosporangium phytohabitans TaxID=860235 RepID=A0A0N9I1N4_9PSEU|nr:hypothetical protein [Kibdelosporangium phytohabitans]ALG12424.1 hypothetical protein AOZ06_41165 [Kibdelosporangium phytohabitans]MBE1464010.1 hypothetical protein [Kibdelosporangium phytohabitans]
MNWREKWPEALRAWGRFTKVHDPDYCVSTSDAKAAGLTGSFAMFRLNDRTVVLDMQSVAELGLGDMPVEVMAHEIGHHVLCPADLADNARLLSRVRRGVPGFEQAAPLVANLYADMLINDRLQRSRGLRMAELYERITAPRPTPLWTFYMRAYEILWSLESGTLTRGEVTEELEGHAQLCARLVRVYATDWLRGAGGFAALCFHYLATGPDGTDALSGIRRRVCVGVVGDDTHIPGLTAADDEAVVHPALDPQVNEFAPQDAPADEPHAPATSTGQFREPFEYGQLLRQLGLNISDETAAARYYRERAAPHLVRFPMRTKPLSAEPLPEGHSAWDIGEPLEAVDWLATATRSPVVIPGVTTVQAVLGTTEGTEKSRQPVDLDLYVDSSGSMPDPRRRVSYLTLAGAILALSALRVGARVQVTLWSGAKQFLVTDGFVRDDDAIMNVLTGYFGGGTAFPLHMLRRTYLEQERTQPTHIVVISDTGVDTMVRQDDEFGRPGGEISARALAAAGAGGTLVLNVQNSWESTVREILPGWAVHSVSQWRDLVEFAAAFSRAQYERSTA